jgi:hypothetical protein
MSWEPGGGFGCLIQRSKAAAIFRRRSSHPRQRRLIFLASDLPMRVMKLVCASCHRHWTPKRRQKRTDSCPACRHLHLSEAQRRVWHRRRLLAPTGPVPEPGPYLAADLDRLMAEADRAAAKALEAALSITRRRL